MKRLLLLATGGTIAGRAADATRLNDYTAGAMAAEQLLAAVPQLQALATINQAGHDGSWQAHAWLLERRHKGYRRDAPQEPQNLESLEEEVQTPEQIIEAIAELPEEILVAALNRRSVSA